MTTSNEHNNAPAVLDQELSALLTTSLPYMTPVGRARLGQDIAQLYSSVSAPAVAQGEPVAWLDLSKMSASAMVYATGWKSNDKQSPLYATPAAPEQTVPSVVWIVSNKTSSTVFATEEFAQKFISSFSGSVAGGFSVSRVDVIGARQPATDAGVMAQEAGLTDEERQQVFRAAENRMVHEINLSWRNAVVDEVIAALRAKGQS